MRGPGAWPGVVHAGLFEREPGGELRLGAQRGEPALDLARVLGRGERLLGSPLRAVFPGLVAAAADAVVLLDVVAKAGDPSMAAALRAHGVDCVLALPVPGSSAGEPRGALCLSFKAAPPFTHEEFALLLELAELAGIGLRLADLQGERAGMLARIAQLSTIDALTGVANRRHGESLLEAEVKRARRYGLPLAVIAFDIDRFSEVNARFGHPVGDLALRAVAEATQKMLRGSDILVRAGDEEFIVIAPHASAADGLKVAEKLRGAIAATVIPGVDGVTVSLGVAALGEQESADSLAVRVNAALARAKRAGRNGVELALQ
ncbi:GGDEF domain-containing protein [Massilia sp. Dwa41.01b]|uniref:GGDEF domain-containing protein n=1 Tax=Massilia sp. Dwa41.01b TaxID=2709302 RepID=UPI0016010830|nr:GGDEF domain-containing protein [Massilia sp. Dwa41.01b]QNA88814.1 GGDEF domain-containing protein [Massilia sp. Dwa41.01b]